MYHCLPVRERPFSHRSWSLQFYNPRQPELDQWLDMLHNPVWWLRRKILPVLTKILPVGNPHTRKISRGEYMNGVEAVSVAKNPQLHFLYGKTLPLFLSDIFLLSETKCQIFPDICTWYFHIFIPLFLSNIFSQMINDPQWSMVFNDHSILLHRDYY